MPLEGKGYWIWKIRDCENGDPAAIAALAHQAGFSHVLVKIADGEYAFNIDKTTGADLVPPLVRALRNRGIAVYGWHYIYGADPTAEANLAVQRVKALGLQGYVLDAEAEFKQTGKDAAARRFMSVLRTGLPTLPIGLSSYRYPSYHPQIPWKDFLEKCDFNMPQVYWIQAHNPADQLRRSLSEFQSITPFRPLIPTGAAFKEGTWSPTTDDVSDFLRTARLLNLSAANFWEWSNTRRNLPPVWDAIKAYDWKAPPIALDIAVQLINALNTRDPAKVAALYAANGVHVTAGRTIQGQAAIRDWYAFFFTTTLPNAAFTLTNYTGAGSSRHLTWTAASPTARILNGSDTLALANGKIAYHYTTFTVTR